MKTFLKILIWILIILILVLIVRGFSGDEDLWICKDGQWERHGNPTLEKPTTPCIKYDKAQIEIGGKIIEVDVSDTDYKREVGLSGRNLLSDDTGMLFIFEKEGNYGFWMKDMNFPIDIVWINTDFSVIGIEKSVAISTYPKAFGQDYFAKYVLELPSGFSDKNSLMVGNKISILEISR
ncbi:MAG: DUF192 domain-containing protein [Candidatus Paceibacterota bacterium]|jgi:hypothetical protein